MKLTDQALLEKAYKSVIQKHSLNQDSFSYQTELIDEAKKKKLVTAVKDENKDGKINKVDDYLANRKKKREEAINKGKSKSKKKDEEELREAYQQILENKHINKKFAKRYNRVTSELLRATPGSRQYLKLKNEREDLVSILKDHNMSPADLDELLTTKEKEEIKDEVEKNHAQEEKDSITTSSTNKEEHKNKTL